MSAYRLTAKKAAEAKAELIEILKNHPEGCSAFDLSGTPKFHGMWTLTSRQIHKLLNNEPIIGHRYIRSGRMKEYSFFWYKGADWKAVAQMNECIRKVKWAA